jgi:ribonucleotide monophosphatase NagD (HAD superfamily)
MWRQRQRATGLRPQAFLFQPAAHAFQPRRGERLEAVTQKRALARMQAVHNLPSVSFVACKVSQAGLVCRRTPDSIRAGAHFIATNRDPTYPTERWIRPGAGAVVAAIEVASGITPVTIGKPEPLLMEEAAQSVGRDPKEAYVIGDGIVTDLAAANAVGAKTILMLTGVTTGAALEALPSADKPFAIAADATELAQVLEGLASA